MADLVPRDAALAGARAEALLRELADRGPRWAGSRWCRSTATRRAVWVARDVPLARGWLRQLDTARGAPVLRRVPRARPDTCAGCGRPGRPTWRCRSGRLDWPSAWRGRAAAPRRARPAGGVVRPLVAAVPGVGRRRGARRTARSSPATGPGWWWTYRHRAGSRSRCGGLGGRRSTARAAASDRVCARRLDDPRRSSGPAGTR